MGEDGHSVNISSCLVLFLSNELPTFLQIPPNNVDENVRKSKRQPHLFRKWKKVKKALEAPNLCTVITAFFPNPDTPTTHSARSRILSHIVCDSHPIPLPNAIKIRHMHLPLQGPSHLVYAMRNPTSVVCLPIKLSAERHQIPPVSLTTRKRHTLDTHQSTRPPQNAFECSGSHLEPSQRKRKKN